MRYAVDISKPARQNIQVIYDYLCREAPVVADDWIDGLLEAIESLGSFPRRCSLAPENSDHPEEIRQLIYSSHRILFAIGKQRVHVLHIRHCSRDRAGSEDMIERDSAPCLTRLGGSAPRIKPIPRRKTT